MKFIDRSLDSTINLVGVCNRRKRTLRDDANKKEGALAPSFYFFIEKYIS